MTPRSDPLLRKSGRISGNICIIRSFFTALFSNIFERCCWKTDIQCFFEFFVTTPRGYRGSIVFFSKIPKNKFIQRVSCNTPLKTYCQDDFNGLSLIKFGQVVPKLQARLSRTKERAFYQLKRKQTSAYHFLRP